MDKLIDYTALGKRIRKARKLKGLSQDNLGEACSISTAHIGHIERGTRIPSLETLFKISNVLNISMDYIFFDSQTELDGVLRSISTQLAGKGGEKVKIFISTVKALADKIDEL